MTPVKGFPLFNGDELGKMFVGASCAIFNRDEFSLFAKKTGMDESAVAAKVDTLIITNGERGSTIFTDGEKNYHRRRGFGFNDRPDRLAVGRLSCALLHGLLRQWRWPDIGRFASLIAGIKALSEGGQKLRHQPKRRAQ